MPELPDLEAMRTFFNARIVGVRIISADVRIPMVVRASSEDFHRTLTGNAFESVFRRGKFLVFPLNTGEALVVNLMLWGRFRYSQPRERMPAKACFVISLENGHEIRYVDDKLMGKVYLVPQDEMAQRLPQWAEMGPDVLDPELTEQAFIQRMRRYTGQIKNVLLNQSFVAGIGNAYADEILFAAGIHPYRKRTKVTLQEQSRLYQAMHSVLAEATVIVKARMEQELLPRDEIRDFLKVHMKGGQPCPRCGSTITQIGANQRITNFCRHCQT